MDNELINRINENGNIPLGAFQVFTYIATKIRLSTNELGELTSFPRQKLNRYIHILENKDYITINSEYRPFVYELSGKGKKIWEGG